MKRISRRKSIKTKIGFILVIGFILPFLVQIFLVSVLLNSSMGDKIFKMARKNIENTALQIQDNLQAQYDMTWFYKNDELVIKAVGKLSISSDKVLKELQGQIKRKLLDDNNIERYSYPFHFFLLDYKGNMMTNYTYTPYGGYPLIYEQIEKEEWFMQLKRAYTDTTKIFVDKDYLNSSGPQKIYVAANIIKPENQGIFVIAIDAAGITGQMQDLIAGCESRLISNKKAEILKSGNTLLDFENIIKPMLNVKEKSLKDNEFIKIKLAGQKQIVMEQKVIVKGYEPEWNLLVTVPLAKMTGELKIIFLINLMVLIFYIMTVLFVLSMLNRNIAKPIVKLRNTVKEVTNGNLDVVISDMPDNELGELGKGFQTMAYNLNTHIEEIRLKEIHQRKMEIRLLQSQIKPHFVRNVLNTIRWLAEINGATSVSQSILALSGLLEYNFRDSEMLGNVKDELAYVRQYMYLQKIRFQNKFRDEYQIEDGILNCRILKLTFQPIVENCIYHGILNNEGLGIIRITGIKDKNKLIFKIIDNGCGITESELSSLLKQPLPDIRTEEKENTDKIALFNIHERIQKQFGPEYGIQIESTLQKGTVVTILFPVLEEAANENIDSR